MGGVSTGGLVSSKEAGNSAVEEVRWGDPVLREGVRDAIKFLVSVGMIGWNGVSANNFKKRRLAPCAGSREGRSVLTRPVVVPMKRTKKKAPVAAAKSRFGRELVITWNERSLRVIMRPIHKYEISNGVSTPKR
ncbi:6757_t:CDS:2 [Acaulospora colombiana]|uniref:6757_t:CDS:1 n=1 Tax=Acaulospora colombiana TaxID=27376 RepID=A0ACA9MHP7_9GLOM|nr:6757_t:CDS:2 [Acaulospora colombiana]